MFYPTKQTHRTLHCLWSWTLRGHSVGPPAVGRCTVRPQTQLNRQRSLSRQKVLRTFTDEVNPMAYAYHADPADIAVESDSEFHGVLLRAPKNQVNKSLSFTGR